MLSLEKKAAVSAAIRAEETSVAFKRRFMIRMISVLAGGKNASHPEWGLGMPCELVLTARKGFARVQP